MTDITSSFLLVTKLLSIIGGLLYGVFALILVRQEHLMADVLEEGFEPVLRLLVLIHAIATGIVVFLAIVLL